MAPRVTTRIAAGPSTADIRAAPGNAIGTIDSPGASGRLR